MVTCISNASFGCNTMANSARNLDVTDIVFPCYISLFCGDLFPFRLSSKSNAQCPPLNSSSFVNRPAYTFLQSVMHLPTLPNPATSTTFSCHESRTLIAEPELSFCAPGLPPIWENPAPVLCGVMLELRAWDFPAIPLYLSSNHN